MYRYILYLFLIFVTYFTVCFINFYAILKLAPASSKLDKPTQVGVSATTSAVVVLFTFFSQTHALYRIDLYLLGAITGIGYTCLELMRPRKETKLSIIEELAISKHKRAFSVSGIFLKKYDAWPVTHFPFKTYNQKSFNQPNP